MENKTTETMKKVLSTGITITPYKKKGSKVVKFKLEHNIKDVFNQPIKK